MSRRPLNPAAYLTPDQTLALLAALNTTCSHSRRPFRGPRLDRLIIHTLLYSGLRCSELCALQLRDTPFFHGKPFLYVRDGKGHVTRSVEIPSHLVTLLTAYLSPLPPTSNAPARPAYHPAPADPSAPLIHTHAGRPLARHTLYSRIRRLGLRYGIHLHPHMLRHTYATLLLSTSGNLALVQDQLGHRDPETTRIYAQILAPDRTAALSHLPTL